MVYIVTIPSRSFVPISLRIYSVGCALYCSVLAAVVVGVLTCHLCAGQELGAGMAGYDFDFIG